MKLDLGSFAFGSSVVTGGNTPSWGTSLGQQRPDLKFTYPGYDNIIIGMMYKSIPINKVFIPLGKGGHVCNSLEDEGIQLAAMFDKVYINEVKVDAPFIMLIYQDGSDSWAGRRTLKYNTKIEYRRGQNDIIYNSTFVTAAKAALQLADDACWVVSDMHIVNQDELHLIAGVVNPNHSESYPSAELRKAAFIDAIKTTYDKHPNFAKKYSSENSTDLSSQEILLDTAIQIIFYGAPGTGKSHKIKEKLAGVSKENIFRTTFHPDSDYSTFVGAYKPSTDKPEDELYNKEELISKLTELKEQGVTYAPQKFGAQYWYSLKQLTLQDKKDILAACEMSDNYTVELDKGIAVGEELLKKSKESRIIYKFIPQAFLNAYMRAYSTTEKVYLIIEEINRGNCAQIFGDLFQLLDRDEEGVSEYRIKADADLRAYLEEELGADSDAIKDGELCLPSNLYIYATMNTSDQSLFPIDSAFKRRWDWEYEPIKYKNINWVIDIEGSKYLWTSFQREINKRIFDATNSEDKMLGDYFVNPTDGVITEKILLNKILFYLWNDVCKDGEGDIFKTADNEEVTFSDLHSDGGKNMLIAMMKYLKVQEIVEDTDAKEPSKRKNPKYSINNSKDSYSTPETVCHVIQEYAEQNQGKSVQEMIDLWNGISERNDCLVDSWAPSPNDKQPFANKRRSEIKWGDKSVWVTRGWTEEIFQTFIRNAKEQLGVIIEKVE